MLQRVIESVPSKVTQKLGACGWCMRLSGQGALLAWVAFASVYVLSAPLSALLVAGGLAAAFSALALAHAMAFLLRFCER